MTELKNSLAASTGSTSDTASSGELYARMKADIMNGVDGYLDKQDGYNCPTCRNKGFVTTAVYSDLGYWHTVTQECKCAVTRRSIRRMERSGLKDSIANCRFTNYTVHKPYQSALYNTAVLYAEKAEGWLFFGGQSGIGKTHLCTAVCRELLLRGYDVQYMRWRDDVVPLKAAVKDEERYAELIDRYKRVQVLYIDDLFKSGKDKDGSKAPTAADVNIAFEILNYRYANPKLLTIISSELCLDEIISIDEATGGRIYERAKKYTVNIGKDKAKNYRLSEVTSDAAD